MLSAKFSPNLVLYALTFLKIGGVGVGVPTDCKLHFHYHFGHVFFFLQANRLYGLIGCVKFSVSFLDRQLILV